MDKKELYNKFLCYCIEQVQSLGKTFDETDKDLIKKVVELQNYKGKRFWIIL